MSVPYTRHPVYLITAHMQGRHQNAPDVDCPTCQEKCTSTDPTNHQGDTCPIHESNEMDRAILADIERDRADARANAYEHGFDDEELGRFDR